MFVLSVSGGFPVLSQPSGGVWQAGSDSDALCDKKSCRGGLGTSSSGRFNERCGGKEKHLLKYRVSQTHLWRREKKTWSRGGVDKAPYVLPVTSSAVYSSCRDVSRSKT